MKRIVLALAVLECGLLARPADAQYVTLVGTLQASNGILASNLTFNFTPSQTFYIAGSFVSVNSATTCATSVDGTFVGIGNPLGSTVVSPVFSGTLPAGNYYVKYSFYNGSTETLVSPEIVQQLSSTGSLTIAIPSTGLPAGATGMRVYIGASSGAETLQGSTTGTATFTQSVPLVSGAAVPATNTTICKQVANDAGWPSGTGYNVSAKDADSNTLPGYPMMWQLLGPNTTINLSNGLPYYHGSVFFPTPILAIPNNHVAQSISGPLNLTGYNLQNVGSVGCGTPLPAWNIDCGTVNASTGFVFQGAAAVNHVLLGNGTYYVDSATIPVSVISGLTLYYQTVDLNGTAQTQRPALNFTGPFTSSDSSSPARTNVGLNLTGSEAKLVTAATSGTSGNCVRWIGTGGIGDAGIPCSLSVVQSDVTSSRVFGTTYQNLTGVPIQISGWGTVTGSAGDSTISCNDGATSGLGSTPFSTTATTTGSGKPVGFACTIPVSWYYSVTTTGNINALTTSGKWYETTL